MPYSDPEKQRAAQHKSYLKNKGRIVKANQKRRSENGKGYDWERKLILSEYVNKIKSNSCVECNQQFHYCQMDFDHVRGIKFASVSQLVAGGYSTASIDEEITKCDLVCANCHRLRTFQRKHLVT